MRFQNFNFNEKEKRDAIQFTQKNARYKQWNYYVFFENHDKKTS